MAWGLRFRGLSVGLGVCSLLVGLGGCADDKDSTPKYYLRGRAYDAVSLEPVDAAQLSVIIGTSSKQTKTKKDGTFQVGPIAAGASYRVRAEVNGMDTFEFTGVGLPAIDGEDDRTLIADIPLYKKDQETPAFNLVVSSDAREKQSSVYAAARFVPVLAGTDPALTATLDTGAAANVAGNYAQPMQGTLPNDLATRAPTYRASIEAGKAEIPAGALKWGATYMVSIDPGPAFSPVEFLLTPVKGEDIQVTLQRAPSAKPADTDLSASAQQYFTGRVYNGVSLERLTDYTMRLEYYDRVIDATVSEDGRYVVGPLLPNADYSIVIESKGYRSFLSHNAKITAATGTPTLTSFYYDAFLYPENVKAPAVHARFDLQGSTSLPSGSVRFAPRSGSSLFNEDDETPAGVARQVWSNDEDMQQRAIVKDFANGVLDIPEGELVLGVSYEVSVFGVTNYGLLEGGTYRAGFEINPVFILTPAAEPALQIVAVSSQGAKPSPDGRVEILFNQAVSLYPRVSEATVLRAMNDAFGISSPDKDADTVRNTLVNAAALTPPVAPTYRGVTFEISGDRLFLKWDRSYSLTTTDADDPINSITYGGLSNLQLYTAALPNSSPVTLGSLLNSAYGSSSLQVQLQAQ